MIFKNQIVRYLIAGTSSAMTQLVLTFILTHFFHLYYLSSSCLGFVAGFMVSFLLQKFWTFQDLSQDRNHFQVPVYLGLAITGLILNSSLLYLLVEYAGLWYVFAQFIAMGVVSTGNFFAYKFFVFRI
ncbi:MAG TPA: GtrA family protein [Candidatus Paceibacterota bacterium]